MFLIARELISTRLMEARRGVEPRLPDLQAYFVK
jgi:hypothetical protein